jgi:DNA repair exonuclease SbcCD ATPase subunit
MRIEKLEIRGFGRFQNETFAPGPGMSVIYGFNEAGKTTLLSFVRAMLFGLKSGRRGRDGAASQARRYRPWNGKSFGGILEYALDDGRRFTVGRNFDKNTVYIQDEFSNNITGSFPAGREQDAGFAEQHLGVPESGFERTAFIGQLQTPVNAEGRKILAERLLNLRESADEEISLRRAMKALKEAQLSQVGSDRTTTRPLNLVEARLEDAVREEKELNRLHESRMELFSELDRLKEKNHQLNARLDGALSMKETLLACVKAVQQRELYDQLDKCRQELAEVIGERQRHEAAVAELRSELDGLDCYKAFSRQDMNDLSDDYARFCLLEKELEELRLKKACNSQRHAEAQAILRQYGLFETEKDSIDQNLRQLLQEEPVNNGMAGSQHPAGRQRLFAAIAFITGMAVLAGVILFQASLPGFASTAALILGIVFLGISLFCFLSGRIWEKKNRGESLGRSMADDRKHLLEWMQAVKADDLKEFTRLKALHESSRQLAGELEDENAALDRRTVWIQTQQEELRRKILSLLDRGEDQEGSGTLTQQRIDAWKENLEAYHALLPALREAQSALESCSRRQEGIFREASLLCKGNIASQQGLDEWMQKAAMDLEQQQGGVLQHGGTLQQEISAEEMDQTIKAMQDDIRCNQLAMNTLETRLESMPDDEALQQAHERVEALLCEREGLVFLGKAYETAIQALEEAGVAIQRDYVPALNREMSGILSAVTSGKYSVLAADDSLSLKLRPMENAEEVLPDQLSSGTIDQVYFALRLAAVRLIEKKGETLPLFLDEPFAQYDEERIKEALSLLAEESRTRQIMMFTCKKREVELAAQLFQNTPLCIINLNESSSGG